MDRPYPESITALNHQLLRQNAHLLCVLEQVRVALDPSQAVSGPNVDAANYALGFVFGPRGSLYGRFCAPDAHQWQPTFDYSTTTGYGQTPTGKWCPVCGKVEPLK